MRELTRIRRIGKTGAGENADATNATLDAAWRVFDENGEAARSIIRDQITAEMSKKAPNGFFLVDTGFFLVQKSERPEDAKLAAQALLAVDGSQLAVQQDHDSVFRLAYRLAIRGRREILPAIDRLILSPDSSVGVPQHAMLLDPTLQSVFVYGALGPEVESHLAKLLSAPGVPHARVMEVLNWLGTEASVPSARAALLAEPTKEMAQRVVGYMMRVGGPAGRQALLDLGPHGLSPDAWQYLQGIRADVRQQTVQTLRGELSADSPNGSTPSKIPKLSDAQVRARLDRMYANDGVDDETEPLSVLDSSLPKDELVQRLTAIRSKMLHRLSDEALSDVEITNVLLNAVQYRG